MQICNNVRLKKFNFFCKLTGQEHFRGVSLAIDVDQEDALVATREAGCDGDCGGRFTGATLLRSDCGDHNICLDYRKPLRGNSNDLSRLHIVKHIMIKLARGDI